MASNDVENGGRWPDELPFVVNRQDGGRCFWYAEPTGDYGKDCDTGNDYALAYLCCRPAPPLQWIVRAMPRDKLTGIEIGFLSVVTWAVFAGIEAAQAHVKRGRAALSRLK